MRPALSFTVRLNKYISETGVCSRREADKWIEAGRVTCNGQRRRFGHAGHRGRRGTASTVNSIGAKKQQIYIALNKPVGITCTTEAHIEDNIIDLIGYPERIFPIGRLDKDSEGLILLTNDGDIVNEILRSENNHEKEYIVTVDRPITDLSLQDDGGRRENHGRTDQAVQSQPHRSASRFASFSPKG